MNPQSSESNATQGINLPPPVPEQAGVVAGQNEVQQARPEQPLLSPEAASRQAAAVPPIAPFVPAPAPAHVALQQTNDVITTSSGVVPSVLEDKDLIEKEWVNKAKAIVNKNRDDPYKQSEELTEVRAEYLQKNYNKTIKSGM